MRKIICIVLLLYSIICYAQFTKGGGTLLNSGNKYNRSTAVAGPVAYTDDFEALAEGDIAGQGNWVQGINTIVVDDISGSHYVAPGGDDAVAIYNGAGTIAANQYSQITLGNVTGKSGRIGVACRLTGTGATLCGYAFIIDESMSYIMKITNGVYSAIDYASPDYYSVGYVFKITASGNNISVYYDGNLCTWLGTNGTITDTSYTTGKVGLATQFGDVPYVGQGSTWAGGDL
jgi:hypothetical protein